MNMTLPEDLKNFRAEAGFNLLTPDQARTVLEVVFVIAFVLDLFGFFG